MSPLRPTFDEHLRPGSRLGDFTLGELVDRGGTADVFHAREGVGDAVVVKVLRPPDDPEHQRFVEQRFVQECAALQRLDHPAVVRWRGQGRTPAGHPWLALDWVPGRDLAALLREEQPRPARFLQLAIALCEAVAHAHERGVVHGDLKASNVRVGEDDRITVIDFGLATLDGLALPSNGRVLGSAHGMAPELVAGQPADHRVDVYALGVLLYRGLVGRYPFHGRKPTEIMVAHVHREVPPFSRYRPELRLPDGLEPVVRACLSKRPEERLQTVGELLLELEAISARIDEPWTPPRSARWWLWATGALLGASLLLSRCLL